MTSELKPCPFCGSKKVFLCGWSIFFVNCEECGASGPAVLCEGRPEKEKARAVEAWNTQAERTCRNVESTGLFFECSECGESDYECHRKWAYCPNCGATVVE